MAIHSSVLARRIPWTVEPGGLQSMGSQSWTRLSNKHFHFFHFTGEHLGSLRITQTNTMCTSRHSSLHDCVFLNVRSVEVQLLGQSSLTLSMVLLFTVSVTSGLLQLENVKWEIPELSNSSVLNCRTFWVARCNLMLSQDMWIIPLSSISHLLVI